MDGLPKSLAWVRRFSGLGRLRFLRLRQGFRHPLLEVARIVVLKPAIVRHDLHLTPGTLRYQGDVVGSLQDRSSNGDMSGVLHIVGSSHLGIVTPYDDVVLRSDPFCARRYPQSPLANARQSCIVKLQVENSISPLGEEHTTSRREPFGAALSEKSEGVAPKGFLLEVPPNPSMGGRSSAGLTTKSLIRRFESVPISGSLRATQGLRTKKKNCFF